MDLKAWVCKHVGDDGGDVSLFDVLFSLGLLAVLAGMIGAYLFGGYLFYHDIMKIPRDIPANMYLLTAYTAMELGFFAASFLIALAGIILGAASSIWLVAYALGRCDSIKVIRCKKE